MDNAKHNATILLAHEVTLPIGVTILNLNAPFWEWHPDWRCSHFGIKCFEKPILK